VTFLTEMFLPKLFYLYSFQEVHLQSMLLKEYNKAIT